MKIPKFNIHDEVYYISRIEDNHIIIFDFTICFIEINYHGIYYSGDTRKDWHNEKNLFLNKKEILLNLKDLCKIELQKIEPNSLFT